MSRQKLVINLVVVLLCGIVTISIPVLVNHIHPINADTQDYQLVSITNFDNTLDVDVIWQIELRRGNLVIETWEQIYTAITNHGAELKYDNKNLQLTRHGLAYHKTKTTEQRYHSVVTYKNYTCSVSLN